MKEENPFENIDVALQWIDSVESEKGMIRDKETYPALYSWFETTTKGNVLEIGSGQGVCSSKIDGYASYLGVEPSIFLTERAKELYQSSSREFVVGSAYSLPVSDTSCDAIFSVNVLFHIENILDAIKEMHRVLKIGGKFFIHTADSDALDIWKGFYVNSVIDGKKVTGEVRGPGVHQTKNIFYGHLNREVINALEDSGLTISKITKLGIIKEDRTIFIVIEGEKI